MPPAIVHFESVADCQEAWREAMLMGTAEGTREKYPEAEITTTAATDRRACCHSKHIPEARSEMIASFPNRLTAAHRRTQTQARPHAQSDHEEMANRAVQLIAGRSVFRAKVAVVRRSGTGDADRRASRVPSLSISAIHPFCQPAIPDGGRSQRNIGLRHMAHVTRAPRFSPRGFA